MSETPASIRRPARVGNKKIWRFVNVILDHEPGKYICIQELDGDFGEPNVDGHDENGWRDADIPASTRIIRVTIDDSGTARTDHKPYDGDRISLRDS